MRSGSWIISRCAAIYRVQEGHLMAQLHERMFYEVMWRQWENYGRYPVPWWCQQYFRAWRDTYDTDLFESKQAAFASNAHYRYWHMVGVKDHHQESLIGQAGEIEPVYDN